MLPATPRLPWYSFRWKTIGWIFFWTLLPYSLVVLGLVRLGRNPRLSRRAILVGATVAAMFLAYVGSYYELSRRGLQEANALGLNGFLYVSFTEAEANPC